VLPLCGILFLLAAEGPFEKARFDAEGLQVYDSMPGQWNPDLVNANRRQERTERTFGVLWLAVGGALLATPLFLRRRVWQLGWRMNGAGCGIAVSGFLLSGLGALVCLANGLAMEGAREGVAQVGYLGVLAGAIVAVVGGHVALLGKAKPGGSPRPTVDECHDRLRRAGWSVGETGSANRWQVSSSHGENVIFAEGLTQVEAWWKACQQARAGGMLAPRRGRRDSEEELREFLEDEAKLEDGVGLPRRPRRGKVPFQVRCPHCELRLAVHTSHPERARKCPRCSGEFTVKQVGG
jgi:hypothetical protein